MMPLVRGIRRLFATSDIPTTPELQTESLRLGSAYGGWVIAPGALPPDAVVYSFGVGEDISFDLALIAHSGLEVHAFDPTPRSIEWVRTQRLPSSFHFHAFGIADYDGTATFFPPENPAHVSHTILDKPATAGRAVSLPVRRLGTIMGELGHHHIDLLKMDIEGAEYAVIDDILKNRYPIRQLLVEFHHRFESVGREMTAKSIERLRRAGFRLFSISESGEEFSFLRQQDVN